ncbi:MAG: sugar ABC transporter ATP-binding protein [Caldilineales bacterium]|nr:sugar ABC transporter ATP-binding protein [Caldilineales bacterium]
MITPTTQTDTQSSYQAGERLLSVRGLKKTFPGVLALDGVDFDVAPGEVHALVGENGAGKSTLIKILSGAFPPDVGSIEFGGRRFSQLSPHQAQELGIRTIYQERSLVPWMSVAENIMLGNLPGWRFLVNWGRLRSEAQTIMRTLSLEVDPEAPLITLGLAQQQGVEIAKALYHQAQLLIMDEPTAALSGHEVENLFRLTRTLRARGLGIIYISHHLEEVFTLADRVTVLRDGRVVGTRQIADTNKQELMNMMVGRDLTGITVKQSIPLGDVVLRIDGISRGSAVRDVSLELRRGEIVGLAGMMGSGRTELARLIFGADRPDSGTIYMNGTPLRAKHPVDAIANGIALVPEDRKTQGLVLCLDAIDNVAMVSLKDVRFVVNQAQLTEAARQYAGSLDIRMASLHQEVQYLSGGNQQKLVLAKWLDAGAEVFIFDEPTRGVDIGAKLEIHRLLIELAKRAKALLVISSDLPEILTLSDRVLVMRKGRIAGNFPRDEATEHTIIACAIGEGNVA